MLLSESLIVNLKKRAPKGDMMLHLMLFRTIKKQMCKT